MIQKLMDVCSLSNATKREREESREGKQASENREREVQLIEQVIN